MRYYHGQILIETETDSWTLVGLHNITCFSGNLQIPDKDILKRKSILLFILFSIFSLATDDVEYFMRDVDDTFSLVLQLENKTYKIREYYKVRWTRCDIFIHINSFMKNKQNFHVWSFPYEIWPCLSLNLTGIYVWKCHVWSIATKSLVFIYMWSYRDLIDIFCSQGCSICLPKLYRCLRMAFISYVI